MLVDIAIPISELIDRITICEIKLKYIAAPAKRRNIERELNGLRARLAEVELSDGVVAHIAPLRASNEENFRFIEDVFRLDADGDFGPAYAEAARGAFRANRDRARLKARINELSASDIVEEKTF